MIIRIRIVLIIVTILDKSIDSECRDGRERAAGSGPAVPRVHPGYPRGTRGKSIDFESRGHAKIVVFCACFFVAVFVGNGRKYLVFS